MKAVDGFISFYSLIPFESQTFLALGLLALLAAGFLFIRNSKRTALLLFLAAFFVASGFALIDPFLHTWDESFHALVSKNTSEGYLSPHLMNDAIVQYNPENWVGNYIWLHKPPLSIWQMAVSIDLFGQNLYAVRLPSILAFSLTAIFVHEIAKILFNNTVAFYSALLFILFQFSLEQVAGVYTSDHIDVSFTLYITASLWAYVSFIKSSKKNYLYLIGVFSGLAVLTKWMVGLLIFGAWGSLILILLFTRRDAFITQLKYLFTALAIALLVALPWNAFAAYNYPSEYWHEMSYASRHFFEVIETHSGDIWYYWENLSMLFGEGTLIPLLIAVAVLSLMLTIQSFERKWMLLSFILLPYIFFTFAETKMSNFVNIVSPIILIALTAMFVIIVNLIKDRVKLSPYFSFIIIFLLFTYQLRPKQTMKNHSLNHPELRASSINSQKSIKDIDGNSADLFIYEGFDNYEYIIHMFYHESTAIPHTPSEGVLSELEEKGVKTKVIRRLD